MVSIITIFYIRQVNVTKVYKYHRSTGNFIKEKQYNTRTSPYNKTPITKQNKPGHIATSLFLLLLLSPLHFSIAPHIILHFTYLSAPIFYGLEQQRVPYFVRGLVLQRSSWNMNGYRHQFSFVSCSYTPHKKKNIDVI
jgi:hypothetical protein